MPEAIATTKRKFYKALDNITNPPAARLSSEPSAKRVRRDISGASSSILARHSSTRITENTNKDTANTAKVIPNFAPWSHETFLARLQTFSSVSLWHPKPEAISEMQWAKRGWVCTDVNTVTCKGGCGQRVVVSLTKAEKASTTQEEDDEDEDEDDHDTNSFEMALVERYKALVVDGHSETCLWRKAGCKDDIYRIQVVRPSVWQPELRKRYQSIHKVADSIRDVKLKALPYDAPSYSSPEKLLSDLPADILGPPGEEQPAPEDSIKSLEIALHGWRGSSDSGTELLHCDACFQRIGLWMYQPDYRPSRRGSDDDEETEEASTIDLVEMHREHCPWRNAETQQASGTLSGLNASQVLQRIVSTHAREQRRRSDEQSKAQRGDNDGDEESAPASPVPTLSREEVAQQDKERESRLRKLKSLFTIKRKSAPVLPRPISKPAK